MSARPELSLWWWGEDEAPGLGSWLEDACGAFAKASSGITVARRLLRHERVLPGFPEAAQEGTAPDLHFFWNGIYVIENAWRGDLAAPDDLLPGEELAAFGGGPQSRFRGLTYRAAMGSSVPYIPNLMPLDLHYQVAAGIGRTVLAGQSGESAAGVASARCEAWRRADAVRMSLYREWRADVGAGTGRQEEVQWCMNRPSFGSE